MTTPLPNIDNLENAIKLGKSIKELRARIARIKKAGTKKTFDVRLTRPGETSYYSGDKFTISASTLIADLEEQVAAKEAELAALGYTV